MVACSEDRPHLKVIQTQKFEHLGNPNRCLETTIDSQESIDIRFRKTIQLNKRKERFKERR